MRHLLLLLTLQLNVLGNCTRQRHAKRGEQSNGGHFAKRGWGNAFILLSRNVIIRLEGVRVEQIVPAKQEELGKLLVVRGHQGRGRRLAGGGNDAVNVFDGVESRDPQMECCGDAQLLKENGLVCLFTCCCLR